VVAGGVSDRALVFSGRDGRIIHEVPARQEGEQFGRHLWDVGDADGDGHADFMAGAPLNEESGEGAGAAYLVSGKDASILLGLYGEEAGDNFGSAGAGLTTDQGTWLLVGAGSAGEGDRGRVYAYRGITADPYFVVESDEQGFELGGMFVSMVGDVDGDGVPDVYASDWAHRGKGNATGQVYVHSGADGRRLYTLAGEAAGDGFGIGVADAGDVDGDGYDDLVIGAWQHGGAAPSGGKTYVHSGRDGSLLWAITGKVPGETFGFDATGMGDVDGDGTIDFLLTSAWSAISGTQSGRVFILSGKRP
jgi:hypothetical protein